MEKSCAEHGIFRDIIFSDVELYLKMEEWNFGDNLGLPIRKSKAESPALTIADSAVCIPRTPLSPMSISPTAAT